MCTWRAAVKQTLDGDLISRVQRRIRGSLVLWSGRTDHIAGGLWERARSLMDYEVDAHYSEIACGWRTRGPILLCIYFGSQANSIHIPSFDDGKQFNFFWLPGIISYYISHSMSCKLLHLVYPRSLDLPVCRQKKQPSLHSWHLSVAHQSIVSYYLCCLSIVTLDWAKNICIYGTQADGDQWKQCTRVLQRDRLQSGWEWERGWGQGGEGACTQIANVWERADFHRREVRLNCSKSGAEVANTLGLKTQPA